MTPRYDRAETLAALTPRALLAHYSWPAKLGTREAEASVCPRRADHGRRAFTMNLGHGRWQCFACNYGGDMLGFIAENERLRLTDGEDFAKALAIAARIGGLSSTGPDPEQTRRVDERRRAEALRTARDAEERAARRAGMPAAWKSLATRHPIGEAYLAGRGLDPAELRNAGDVVRFAPNGDPAVALRDLVSGDIAGIQYRHRDGDSKLTCERGSQLAGSALHGRFSDLDPYGCDVAVLVEGLADTLAAALTWRGCAVFGAPAGQLARVAAAVAPRVLACRGLLLVVADNDTAGVEGASAAVVAAVRAGLTFAPVDGGINNAEEVRLVDLGDHHDLASARCAGWLWTWFTVGGAL